MIIPLDSLLVTMLIAIRAGGLLLGIPVFGGKGIPLQVRLALAFFLSLMVQSVVPLQTVFPDHFASVYLMAFNELCTGFLIGLAARMAFFTVELAGHVIATELALMTSASFNPLSGTSTTSIGTVLFYFAVTLFLVTEIHHEVFHAFVHSFELLPAGAPLAAVLSVEALLIDSAAIFSVGLQIAAPVVAVNFIVNLTFAVLGKVVPRMNVFITSFPIRIWAGFLILLSTVGLISHYILTVARDTPERMLRFLSL